jgi:hypothetical protein
MTSPMNRIKLKKSCILAVRSMREAMRDIRISEVLVIIGYLFIALLFLGSRLLSPLHIPLALISIVLAAKKVRKILKRRRIHQGVSALKRKTIGQLIAHKVLVTSLVLIFLGIYAFIALIPTDKAVFSGRPLGEVAQIVEADTVKAAQLIDMIEVTGDALLNNVALYKRGLSPEEREQLKRDWDVFLGAAIASEEVTEVHKYFPQISFFSARELQAQSFTISYALYMKKFVYFHKIITAVDDNAEVRAVLNEHSRAFGSKGSYSDVVGRYLAGNSLLRRNVGYVYHTFVTPHPEAVDSPEYQILLEVSADTHRYVFSHMFSQLSMRSVVYRQQFGDTIGDTWLPVQKTVFVDTIGNVHVSDRKEKLITIDDITTMKRALLPGDIFVARKNWYASNVGIPGFWAHAGIYTGSLDELNVYFADIFPREYAGVTYASFEEFLARVYPSVHETYSVKDMYGYAPSVIESETRGTRIQSIEHSASVDYFGVVRAQIPKEDVLASLVRAYAHFGKPYDYRFDMRTADEIFCSELVSDAFVALSGKRGIQLPRSVVSGMEIVTPNNIIAKFAKEVGTPGAELAFVYFIDGNEESGRAIVASEAEFIKTHERPKFSFMLE